jgi:DnaD/phage-associated family protein
MGQNTGYPTPTQQKYMEKWLGEYRLPAELVMEACDRAAAQIGRPTFAYVNKIIEGWNKKGIKTVEGAGEEAREFAKNKAKKAKNGAKQDIRPKNNRFINFKQRERDYDQLEKLEREYVLKSLQG